MAFALSSVSMFIALVTACAQDANKPLKPGVVRLTLAGTVVDPSGEPASGAAVQLSNYFAQLDASALTDAKGQFELAVNMHPDSIYGVRMVVRSSDKSQVAFHRLYSAEASKLKEIKVRLEPLKTALIKVVDGAGNPIADANVAVLAGFPNTVGPIVTDAIGTCSIELPESAAIDATVAWKSGTGLDYKLYTLPRNQTTDQLTKKPEFPMQTGETLTLDGAAPLSVRITDTDNKSIPNTTAYVWLLKKADRSEELNLSFFTEFFKQGGDASGQVVFDWFPSWQTDPVTVWPMVEGFVTNRGEYEPATMKGSLQIQLERLIPMRGKVTLPDGMPAANITVLANGSGYTHDRYNAGVQTDEQGRYEFKAAPNQIYMLSISDKQWAAPAQSGFAVMPGKEVEDHDFVLRRATRLFGRVLNQDTGKAVPGKTVYLTHQGIDLQAMGNVVLPNPENSRSYVCPMRQQTIVPGEDGKFEFYIGDGEYNLFIQGVDAKKIAIAQEPEKEVDLPIYVQPQKMFTGSALDAESNFPMAGVQLNINSTNLRAHNEWKATTGSDGIFQVSMLAERSYVHALSSDSKLGAILELEADRSSAEIKLHKLGSATGKLLTLDGSGPAAEVKLYYGINIEDKESRMSSNRFGKVITTDSHGEFTMPNLVPGWDYQCSLFNHPSGYILNVVTVRVEPGESRQMGELKTPDTPKPYVPPTIAERTQQAFTVAGTPLQRWERAKQLVKQLNQNLLIVLSEPTDSRAQALMKLRYEDREYRSYADDFRIMAISTESEQLDAAKELAKSLKLPELQADSNFLLAVVNREGEVVARLASSQVCDGEELSKNRLLTELDKYKTTPLDAHELLKQALEKAERENKRVLLQETATWCGPCHMLTRWLLANRQWETDYIWVKMDHRWTGAIEIMKEYRGEAEGGIPWCVILDAQGSRLATSNHFKSGDNVGFPSDSEGQKHFLKMFQSTRIRMTDKDIADLVEAAGKE